MSTIFPQLIHRAQNEHNEINKDTCTIKSFSFLVNLLIKSRHALTVLLPPVVIESCLFQFLHFCRNHHAYLSACSSSCWLCILCSIYVSNCAQHTRRIHRINHGQHVHQFYGCYHCQNLPQFFDVCLSHGLCCANCASMYVYHMDCAALIVRNILVVYSSH